jgi:hypothetical protein
MVCLGNICINTLHKGAKDDNDNNNNNNNNNLYNIELINKAMPLPNIMLRIIAEL